MNKFWCVKNRVGFSETLVCHHTLKRLQKNHYFLKSVLSKTISNVDKDRGFIRELLLLNAENGSMHLIVNVGKIGGSGALTHTTELIVDGTVTKTHPTLVGTQIRHGNATQMGANGRAAQYLGVTGIWNTGLRLLIELSSGRQSVGKCDFRHCETTHKDHLTGPGSLEHFSWGQFWDV